MNLEKILPELISIKLETVICGDLRSFKRFEGIYRRARKDFGKALDKKFYLDNSKEITDNVIKCLSCKSLAQELEGLDITIFNDKRNGCILLTAHRENMTPTTQHNRVHCKVKTPLAQCNGIPCRAMNNFTCITEEDMNRLLDGDGLNLIKYKEFNKDTLKWE